MKQVQNEQRLTQNSDIQKLEIYVITENPHFSAL